MNIIGLWVWLRADWHNLADHEVHFNKDLDRKLKVLAQEKFEEKYSHKEFMKIFGKNYLDKE